MIAHRFAARILLLAALLNALLGMPLHELSHQLSEQQQASQVVATMLAADHEEGCDDGEAAHAADACFWCLSHAGAHALGRLPRLPAALADRETAPVPPTVAGVQPAPQHPPFSPRAPPVQA